MAKIVKPENILLYIWRLKRFLLVLCGDLQFVVSTPVNSWHPYIMYYTHLYAEIRKSTTLLSGLMYIILVTPRVPVLHVVSLLTDNIFLTVPYLIVLVTNSNLYLVTNLSPPSVFAPIDGAIHDAFSWPEDTIPANTKHLYNICTMLDQRKRRWADVVQMLYKCFVFAGIRVCDLVRLMGVPSQLPASWMLPPIILGLYMLSCLWLMGREAEDGRGGGGGWHAYPKIVDYRHHVYGLTIIKVNK